MFDLNNFTRVEHQRSIDFDFPVKEEGDVLTVASLSISHRKAGVNYFSGTRTTEDQFNVSLSNEGIENRNGFTVRSYFLFKGIGLMSIPAGNRFSKKKLNEAAEQGFACFKELVEAEDPRVMRYLNAETAGVAA